MSRYSHSLGPLMQIELALLSEDLRQIAGRYADPIFHSACVAGDIALVKALIGAGVTPDAYPCTEDEDDVPPLTWIARYRDTESSAGLHVAKLLIDSGAGLDEGSPLLAALEAEDVALALILLAAGADPAQDEDELEDRETALLEALLDNGWAAHAHPEMNFFVAISKEDEIVGVGLTAADASVSVEGPQDGLTSILATGRLVARYLSGLEFEWKGDELADLDDDADALESVI